MKHRTTMISATCATFFAHGNLYVYISKGTYIEKTKVHKLLNLFLNTSSLKILVIATIIKIIIMTRNVLKISYCSHTLFSLICVSK